MGLVIDDKVKENLNKIRNFLVKYYKDDGLAEIDSNDTATLMHEILETLKYRTLGLCGCGCQESTVEAIRNYLKAVEVRSNEPLEEALTESRKMLKEMFGHEYVTDDALLQYMAYDLDDRELIEHGSNINGAYITDLGRACLYMFNLELIDQEEEKE